MGTWFRFFFGTPQRFLGSLAGIGFLVCLADPSIFARALNQAVGIIGSALQQLISAIVVAIGPLLGPALTLIIVFAGLRMIVFGGKKGGKK